MTHLSFRRLFAPFGLAAMLSAAAPAGPALGSAEMIERIETYLTSVRTIESDFIQSSSKGDFSRGRLYVARPDSLRLDYEPPSAVQIYGNGAWLIYVDTELEEVTHVPLKRTPAAFLVGEAVSLSDKVTVTGIGMDSKTIRIQVVRSDEPEAGSVILAFARDPLALKNWTVVDAQGVSTRVALVRPRFNGSIDRSVFDFDPDRYVRTHSGE